MQHIQRGGCPCGVPLPSGASGTIIGRRVSSLGRRLGYIANRKQENMTGPIYRPGQTVPVSGIYNVVDIHGNYQGRQITGEAGRTFEPTRHGTAEYGYMLFRQTTHLG
jgi:hypothetical protein